MANTYTATTVADYDENTPLYNELINKVYDWSNRDLAALPARIVRDSVRYAADTAYRTLRIPPLENTLVWTDFPRIITITDTNTDPNTITMVTVTTAAEETAALAALTDTQTAVVGTGPLADSTSGASTIYQSVTLLSIPPDLTEFIQIRGTDATGLTTRVFNEKADVRTFQDISADIYNNSGFWTRMGNNVLITPSFSNASRGFYGGGSGPETRIEMYYYRRLPALNAVYDVSPANFLLGLLPEVSAATTATIPLFFAAGTTTPAFATAVEAGAGAIERFFTVGPELPHWLRDENEKAVLMGGLAECFAYLQEDDQAQKYLQLFQKEITELNAEDRVRDASGGNIQVHYNGRGLI